jgi:hypothetical protein
MPMYDFKCDNGHQHRDQLRSIANRHDPCPDCGCPITMNPNRTSMIGDDIPGGMWVENLGPKPVQVFSKSQLRHEAQMRGLTQSVRHVGVPGSDKSKHTVRWV